MADTEDCLGQSDGNLELWGDDDGKGKSRAEDFNLQINTGFDPFLKLGNIKKNAYRRKTVLRCGRRGLLLDLCDISALAIEKLSKS